MEITVDDYISVDPKDTRRINNLAPNWIFRMVILGESGTGKSVVMLNLIDKFIVYDFLFVYAKNLWQTNQWKKFYDEIEKLEKEHNVSKSAWSDEITEESPRSEDLPPKRRNLIVIDDMINEGRYEKKWIQEFFTSGRHHNASVILILQGLTGTAFNRYMWANTTDICLFSGLYEDTLKDAWKYWGSPLEFKRFKELYQECTQEKGGFLYIDKRADNIHQKFRFKFDNLLIA